ncbi:MAG: tRNA lysidine(34) synthetase TilS, partial [Acidimicrobiia bacterium]
MAEARRLKELAARVISLADLPDGALVVALSGGADSAALLWTCVRLGRQVSTVHVHHGLAASDLMEAAAESVAAQLGVPLTISRVEVGTGASPENQAREARYRAFVDTAKAGEWILTAHTSDDQAETVIDHLLRASGLDGLSGIPARRPPFARPLLAVARSETRELATLAGLPWRDDPVNEDPDPLRNRIRRRLIPALEAAYNPRMRQSLATTAALVARDTQHLEELVGKAPVIETEAGAEVAAAVISTAAPALAARIVRRLLTVAGLPAASSGSVVGVLAVATGAVPSYEPGG